MFYQRKQQSGFTLVELIIVSALITLVFGGLLVGTKYSLELIAHSRAKLSALSLANDRMELFRSLPYDDVGTVAGIPAGVIPQNSTTTLNNIEFTERVLVEYVDDPADGQLTATSTDNNGIPSDYKRIKIEITWNIYNKPGKLSLVSNIVPRSIETTSGGGTVRINVIDQDSMPLSNVLVNLRNDTTTSTVDISRYTNSDGIALFSGAPAASSYEVIVTETGYSTDQTYVATTSNPNPITAPFTVLESDISTLTFQVDLLSDLTIDAYTSISFSNAAEYFDDQLGIATSTNIDVTGGRLQLANVAGSYVSNGEAYLNPIAPVALEDWEVAHTVATAPADTSFTLQFYTASGTEYVLIPDSELPGNASGFSDATVAIDELAAGAYPEVIPKLSLFSSNSSVTPTVDEIKTYYRASQIAASGQTFSVRGNKVIGSDLGGAPIYKYESNQTTSGSGRIDIADLEFDTYTITPPAGYDVSYSCPALPVQHRGGEDSMVEIGLTGNTAHSVLVRTIDNLGTPVPGATVALQSASTTYSGANDTTPCGTAFFPGLSSSADYEITVSKPGFSTSTVDPYTVDGDSSTIVILNPS